MGELAARHYRQFDNQFPIAGNPTGTSLRAHPINDSENNRVEAEVDESVVAEGGGHEDVATVAAGGALGDKSFAAEGHAAVAAVAGLDPDSCFINKHAISSVQARVEVAR